MTPQTSPGPSFQELEQRAHELLSQLAALHDAQQQATAQEQASSAEKLEQATARNDALVKQLDGLRQAERQWALDRKALVDSHQAALKELNGRLTALNADNEALQAFQLQWAADREGHLKARQQAEADMAHLKDQLSSAAEENSNLKEQLSSVAEENSNLKEQLSFVTEENSNLKELHSRVTEQARTLASDWTTRRQTVAADNQRLRSELEQITKTLDLSREREKQWQGQVYKLQDDLRQLRETAGRMKLSDKQSHHLLSQISAITGFAEVLLDEAGNRATSEEREEFLHDIKDSGSTLAEYVNQLSSGPVEQAAGAPDDAAKPLVPDAANEVWTARTILVVASDPGIKERCQAFLAKAGYQVEFATDADKALEQAVLLQPLAIMIDSELPDAGAQALTDLLQREARARDIPVVVMGGANRESLGLSMDRYDFLTKPLNRQQLLQMMVKYDLLADRRRSTKMPTSVLVIDDDARNTRLVKAMLKPYTVNVVVADGGAAGIKLASKSRPDLIILDLMMPDVDGFQVVKALRSDPATSEIPILIYTAKNITSDDRRQLGASIQAIVRKGDLTKEQFLELVYKRGERRNRPEESEAAA